MKVAIAATHPIQYQIPWFQRLSAQPGVDLTVYYALLPDAAQQGIGFGIPFAWDIPLLEGYRWELLPKRSRGLGHFFATGAPEIYRRLRRERPDALLLTGWHSLALIEAFGACMRLGIPLLVRGESNALRQRPPWIRGLHRLLLARMDACLAIGRANRAFCESSGVPAERIFDCPYFVDNDRFQSRARELAPAREAIRAAWGIGPGDACYLFAGKLEPKKRLMDALQALRIVAPVLAGVRLLVVGAGEQMAEARAYVAANELPVSFAGFLNQTEIARAYVAADCLVLPSDFGETWGLVVNEAMACGLPALVSDRVGCGPDLIEAGKTGELFPFGDIPRLAELMAQLAKQPERLKQMGRSAQDRLRHYSVEHAVEGTLRALEYVCGASHR